MIIETVESQINTIPMKTHKSNIMQIFKFEYRITFNYLIFGMLWILFSDILLDLLVADAALLTKFQTYKGALFIFVTAVFLYVFVKTHMQSLRLAEAKLIESESHYKTLFNDNHSIILLLNSDNAKIEGANPAACNYYGWTHTELCSKSIYDFSTLDKNETINWLQTVKAESKNHLLSQHHLANGETREVEIYSSPINIAKKIMIYSVIRDITEQRNAELQLRKLSKAVEQSPIGICITDPAGIIEYVNPKISELTGFAQGELLNKDVMILGTGEKSNQLHQDLWQTISSGNVWSGEFHNKKKNGRLYWESDTISPIFDTSGQITHYLSIKEDITDRKRAEIALNKSEKLLRKFASHLQNVREEEKVAIAREIHDDLGQTLVALKINMGILKNKTLKISNDDLKEIIVGFDEIVNLINETIKSARRIMSGLRPELLEMNGFASAATSYLHDFEERYQIKCEFDAENSDIEMNSQQSLSFFRILQESLNNIAKHSKATVVKVQLKSEAGKLILEVIDNGIGFDVNNSGRQDSYGMIGMKERMVLLGGELTIRSKIGKGTSVRVEIPLKVK